MDISISDMGGRNFLVCGDKGAVPIDLISRIEFMEPTSIIHFSDSQGVCFMQLNQRLTDDLRTFLDDHRLNLVMHRLR